MRLLHLVARSQRRGAEMVALELAHELSTRGHDNRLLALRAGFDGGVDSELPLISERPRGGPVAMLQGARDLRRGLALEPVDVVLAHGGEAAQVAAVGVSRKSAKIVWQRILGFPPSVTRAPLAWWFRAVARRCDGAFALTEHLERELRTLGYTGDVWVVPNFRRTERFANLDHERCAAALRRELKVDDATPLIGFAGHLVPQKRPERAVVALEQVHNLDIPAHLVVAGDGPLRNELATQVRGRGLTQHVTLLGHRRDLERVLAGLDLLVVTSEAEGIPGVVIEAQLSGCPVVTFPVGAVGDVVEDGVSGVVLDRADTGLLAEEVARLLGDADRLVRMREAATKAGARYSADRVVDRYEEILLQLCTPRNGLTSG
jgi:glycosyltransferase involved in cell wall biosynthesis